MNWMESVLIVTGISLDIFAAMECQGSLVAKIDKKALTVICGLIVAWQMAALTIGNYLSNLLCRYGTKHDETVIGLVLASVIFFCLGVRLIIKAVRNEHVHEHLEEKLGICRSVRMAAVTSLYTLLTGIAIGFLGNDLITMLITVLCLTVAVVIAGMYTGYRLGSIHKAKAYIGGALLLWIAGIDVIVRHIMY